MIRVCNYLLENPFPRHKQPQTKQKQTKPQKVSAHTSPTLTASTPLLSRPSCLRQVDYLNESVIKKPVSTVARDHCCEYLKADFNNVVPIDISDY